MKYPDYWPKPPIGSESVASRITEEQKTALFNRQITTRDLAKTLRVSEKYLSSLFPGKDEENTLKRRVEHKQELVQVRKEYRLTLAKDILTGKYSIADAADIAGCSYNTMLRTLAKAKAAFPQLTNQYEEILRAQRQELVERARSVRNSKR